jgi:DNA-binding NtrC family response regulator
MGNKLRLLIIDDSKETVVGLKAFLGKKYNILTAYNGRDAIKKFAKNEDRIDLVITDIIMPHVSGIALISMIKKKFPEKPIIAMTGWGYQPETLAVDEDADMVLEKPFEMDTLERAIEELLRKEKQLKQIESRAAS